MFQTIYELPTQVRSSLDEDDQKKFMEAYNKEAPKTEEEVDKAMRKAWHACSKLPSSFSFKIVAAMDAVDKDKEIIDPESVKDSIDSFIKYGGNVQWEHANYNVGCIWDWEPIKKDGMDGVLVYGNLFGGDLVYDKMRKNFVDGKNSLSVGGEADHGKFQCDNKGCYVKRNVKQLLEISLCAVPANKHCKLEWYNKDAKLTKSASSSDDIHMDVVQYEIHKSYKECPIQALKKSLSYVYPEVHATEDGVFVPMSFGDFLDEQVKIRKSGLRPIWTGKGAMIQDFDIMYERAFKDGHRAGIVDDDGYLTAMITKSDFEMLYGWGIIDSEGRFLTTVAK